MTSLSNGTAQVIAVVPKRIPKSATRMLRLPRMLDDWLVAYAAAYGYRSVPELIVQTMRELRARNQLQLNALTANETMTEAQPEMPRLPFDPLP
jgi:hypothetical protein